MTKTEAEGCVVIKAKYQVEPAGELRAVPADRASVCPWKGPTKR